MTINKIVWFKLNANCDVIILYCHNIQMKGYPSIHDAYGGFGDK